MSPGSGTFASSSCRNISALHGWFCCVLRLSLCSFSSATNRIITAKDHASVQINIGHLDANGLYDGHFTTFALSGFVRAQVTVHDMFIAFV
jgi:hypothetical protein